MRKPDPENDAKPRALKLSPSGARQLIYALLLIFAGASTALADTHLWTGAGLTGNWSLPANWQGNNPPAAGENPPMEIIFPEPMLRHNNTNNVGGLVLDLLSIAATNVTIQGAGPGTNVTFRGGTFNFGGYGQNDVLGPTMIITVSNQLNMDTAGSYVIQSRLVGSGSIVLNGAGSVTFNCASDNTFSGGLFVSNGVTVLDGGFQFLNGWYPAVSAPGPVTMCAFNASIAPQMRMLADAQINPADVLTISTNSVFEMNGHAQTVAGLEVAGNSGILGPGTLTVNGNIHVPYTLNGTSEIAANLNLNGATRTLWVDGTLQIFGQIMDGPSPAGIITGGAGVIQFMAHTNTYSGNTTIAAGELVAFGDGSLGTNAASSVYVEDGGLLALVDANISGKPLYLNGSPGFDAMAGLGTSSWSGPITLATDVEMDIYDPSATLILSGNVSGPGGLTKVGEGILQLVSRGPNTYSGSTFVDGGEMDLGCGFVSSVPTPHFVPTLAVPGPLEIGADSAGAATVLLLADNEIAPTAGVRTDGGYLNLNAHSCALGPITLDGGSVATSGGALTLTGDVTTTINGGGLYGVVSLGGVSRQFNSVSNGFLSFGAIAVDGGASAGLTINGGYIGFQYDNHYTGPTVINNNSICIVESPYCFGGTSGILVNAGGQIELAGVSMTNAAVTLNGAGPDGSGALVSGLDTYWAGPVYLASDSVIGTYAANETLTVIGAISGPGGLQTGTAQHAAGRFVLAGPDDNSFDGALTVPGTNLLILAKSQGAAAVPGNLVIGNDLDTIGSAEVRLTNNNQLANDGDVFIRNSGELNLNGFNDAVGSLTFSGGSVFGQGKLTTFGPVSEYGVNDAAIFCQTFSLGGESRAFYAEYYLNIFSPMIDGGASAGIVKNGPGVVSLSASNSFSGETVIAAGDLQITDNHALGKGNGGVFATNAGDLLLVGVTVSNKTLTISGDGYGLGALQSLYTSSWLGSIEVLGTAHIFVDNPPDQLTIGGPIGGPGALVVNESGDGFGEGTLVLSGPNPNTYAGDTLFGNGRLLLNKPANVSAIPGNLDIGSEEAAPGAAEVRLLAMNQIASVGTNRVRLFESGYLNLNNYDNSVKSLDLVDACLVSTGAGLLTLLGNLSAEHQIPPQTPSGIYGLLSLGGASRAATIGPDAITTIAADIQDGGSPAGFNVTGGGLLAFYGSNTFSGPVFVSQALIYVNNDSGLGAPGGGTTITNGGNITLNNVNIASEALTVSGPTAITCLGTNSWHGPINLPGPCGVNTPTNAQLELSGVISGPGGLQKNGSGKLILDGSSSNSNTGQTMVWEGSLYLSKTNALAIVGPLGIGAGNYGPLAVTTLITQPGQLGTNCDIMIRGDGLLALGTVGVCQAGSFSGSGALQLGLGSFRVGYDNVPMIFGGAITGLGSSTLVKQGAGTFSVTGSNSFFGQTLVGGGSLLVDGYLGNSAITVSNGATLGGRGSVGPVTALTDSTVTPGYGQGVFNSGNMTLSSAATYVVKLGPTNGTNQLNATGAVNLGSSFLNAAFIARGQSNAQYTIIKNDGSDVVTGTFSGLAEGATFTANNGAQLKITYHGGTGNDVVLTQVSDTPMPSLSGLMRGSDGSIQFTGNGIANLQYTILASADLSATNWFQIGTATVNETGTFQFTDFAATNCPQRFYEITWP